MRIDRNKELGSVLDIIRINLLTNASDVNPLGHKYEDCKITPAIEKEMIEAYAEIGLPNYTLKRNVSEVLDLPYNRDIKLFTSDGLDTGNLRGYIQKKNMLVPLGYGKHTKYLNEYIEHGYYNKTQILPQITENGNQWMTPIMMEYNTMKDSIDKAHGNVLTFGLGMAFYAYMCLLKDEVKSVTVVERNADIIAFFEKVIRPQFKIDKEIIIIHGDLFDYYNDAFLSKYDYTFVDIWLNNNDGIRIYKDILKLGVAYDKVDFWVEESFLIDVRRVLGLFFIKWYEDNLSDFLIAPQEYDSNFIYCMAKATNKVLKNIDDTLDSEEKLLYYLHNKDLLRDIIIASCDWNNR